MKPQNEMNISEIQTVFEKARDFLWVDLTGGEVTLRKDFIDICRAVIENCPNLLLLHFATNGYLPDKIVENVKAISKTLPEKLIITVSTDGDEETNDRIRGVDGGWKRQMETFRRLREIKGVQTVLGMTFSQSNVRHFPDAFQAAKKEYPSLKYTDYHVNIVHESDHFFDNKRTGVCSNVSSSDLSDAVEQYAHLRGPARSPVSLLERAYMKRVRRYLETSQNPIRCQALKSSCFIDPWGNVFPCTIYNRKVGSLRDSDYDLREIWNRPETEALQEEIWDNKCPQCWTPCEAYQSILGSALRPWDRNVIDPTVSEPTMPDRPVAAQVGADADIGL
jgi:MoaA/NifB/PqqE/SkfB family radical SAM enzyme